MAKVINGMKICYYFTIGWESSRGVTRLDLNIY